MLHFEPIEESDMQIVDGDVVLNFIAGVEKAIDDAGVGQHRAFKLIAGLKAIGISLKADAPPAQEAPKLRAVDSDADAA